MRMSDVIEEFIKDLFDEDESDLIEIQRNDLAQKFNCVPSQINYVIATRFKPAQGYYVESRRGGGGHITIRKVNNTKEDYLMHIINNMGNSISNSEAEILISDFLIFSSLLIINFLSISSESKSYFTIFPPLKYLSINIILIKTIYV